MALLHIAYERLVTGIHNEDTIEQLPRRRPPPRPAALPGPLVRSAGADAARDRCSAGSARAVTGEVTLGCAAATTTRSSTPPGPNLTYQPERLTMEKVEDAAFSPQDRIGQLTMRNLDIADTRDKLDVYRSAGTLGPGGVVALESGEE